MEQFLVSALSSLGVAGIGYFFMYILLKHHFESSGKTAVAVEKLCDKIDELVESNLQLQKCNSENAAQAAIVYTETKEQSSKIINKIDSLNTSIGEIRTLNARIFDKMNSTVRLGQVLVQKGTITQDQLDDALEEQRKFT